MGWSTLATAQTLTVAVDGISVATGTTTKSLFKASCDADTNETGDSVTDEVVTLNWTPSLSASYRVFWTTNSGDCSGGTSNNDGGTFNQPTSLSNTSIGGGTFAFTKRALLRDVNGVAAGTSPCEQAPLSGTAYVCVTEDVQSYSTIGGTSTTTLDWYMTFSWDTNLPAAPGGSCGSSGAGPCASPGDSDIGLSWTYSDSVKLPDHFVLYYQPDPTASVAGDGGCLDANGNLLTSKLPYNFFDFGDGGCDGGSDCADGGDGGLTDSGVVADNTVGVCGGCQSNIDCSPSTSLCLIDSSGNSYCATQCDPDAGYLPGGNYGCPSGFQCQQATDVSGISSPACLPPDGLCRPTFSRCGICAVGDATCGSGNLCVPSPDGGATFCAIQCSDGGTNGNGSGSCLGDTVCQTVVVGLSSAQRCAPASGGCYDATSLATVLDGGGQSGGSGGGAATDAGVVSGFSGSVAGWSTSSVSGDNIATSYNGRISGLDNGVCYDVVLQTVLADGTAGDLSGLIVAAPVRVTDFWRLYQSGGGNDRGGAHCQSGSGAVGLLGSLAVLLVLRRRRPLAGPSPETSEPGAARR